ncbi:hypothetical protein YUWDRAFT_00495 [Streptomyces sp. AmelKG-D3]|nr:hypothetical protein YUWDRAFT_00495 [Streptomyces sp. AmelKG-D3]
MNDPIRYTRSNPYEVFSSLRANSLSCASSHARSRPRAAARRPASVRMFSSPRIRAPNSATGAP